jgi:hypothetical protein
MKKILRITFLVSFLFAIGLSYRQAVAQTVPINVFVVVGQSNAVGGDIVIFGQPTNTRFSKWAWNSETWQLGMEPSNGYVPLQGSESFGQSFGVTLLNLIPDKTYTAGMVNCAINASRIEEWQKGTVNYNRCMSEISTIVILNPSVRIKALIFYQGESNSDSLEEAELWTPLYLQFVRDFRADVGRPNLPVIYVQLGPDPHLDPQFTYWSNIQSAQLALSNTDPMMKMVTASNLTPILTQPMHITGNSEIVLGVRIAKKYYNNFYK